jgi:hypothetical protein
MAQLPLDRLMRELAVYLGTTLDYDRGVYSVTVPLPFGRRQEVRASVRNDDDGRNLIVFVSTVGQVRRGLDAWSLLKANGDLIYCRVALLGTMVAVIASQLLHTAQPEEVLLILREVAQCADQLERSYFVGDHF